MVTYTANATGDIAFLGPQGTYCDEAANRFAKRLGLSDATLVPCQSFHRVFDAVASGRTEFGVVALENSIEGPVTATLDSFAVQDDVTILGEEIVDIHHCLVAHPDADVAGIQAIASHSQAIAQCRGFLERHFPSTPVRVADSTSEAALIAAGDPHIAAIANARAAELAGAAIVYRDIADHGFDQTNFALIARTGHAPALTSEGPMKTSLALFLHDDRPGALHMILAEFTYGGINLTKIQSRPTKKRLGEYMFFIDIDGSAEDEAVRIALDCLRLKLREVKVLGCYPTAKRP